MQKQLPEHFEVKKIILKEFGGYIFGWDKKTILEFLNNPISIQYVVLGGDVLKFNSEKGKYEYTYDNWYVPKRQVGESFPEYSIRAKEKSIEYIMSYPGQEGILFAPTITSEITAGF